jgi:hypothetical protein
MTKWIRGASKIICLGIMITVATIQASGGAPPSDDYSSPEAAFRSLQNSVRNRDLAAFYHALYKSEAMAPFEDIEQITEKQKARHWKKFEFLEHAQIIRVELIPAREGWNTDIAQVWWRWPAQRLMGRLMFGRVNGEWKFTGIDEGGDTYWPSYDFSTPLDAFQSLRRATRREAQDTLGVYDALASEIRGSASFSDYESRIKISKKAKGEWVEPDFRYDPTQLEVETLRTQGNKQQARVWKLDREGKRAGFELFVKQGTEWKWIPDPKAIWHPKSGDP